jgi:hypothetical protein
MAYAQDPGPGLRAAALASLPMPVSNNAVTVVRAGGREFLVSFAGLGEGKSYRDVLGATFVLEDGAGEWQRAADLPGGQGRLAASAASVAGQAYIFGGYTVAEDGSEVSTPWVHAFDPLTGEYRERRAMPVPVDDAVALSYQDRYIYLISGWHDLGNVNLVQRYDALSDEWIQATPIPGSALFGHAGGIVGNRIVYCDGVTARARPDRRRDFVTSGECFLGIVDQSDSRKIDWRSIAPHPGLPRYRMAAAGITSRDAVLFIGGSENPYNYDGIGYDGKPSEPARQALLLDLRSLHWSVLPQHGHASMDHRGLPEFGGRWLIVGGMLEGQALSDRVVAYTLQ